jgi:hypothetical protein
VVAGSGMQAKLHRWAASDPGRRFDDLFNLVHDPATLIAAFERVAGNQGANTPGVDGVTAAWVEEMAGVPWFLDDLRAALKDGSFRPLPVRERMIPKPGGSGKLRRLGIPTEPANHPVVQGIVRFRNRLSRSRTRFIRCPGGGCGCCSSASWLPGWRSAARAARWAR